MTKITLRLAEEETVLPARPAPELAAGAAGWAQTEPADPLGEAGISAWIAGRVSGERAAAWQWRALGVGTGPTRVYRTDPAWHLPGSGLVIADDGAVAHGTAAKAQSPQPSLAGLPGVRESAGGDCVFTAPRWAPQLGPSSLFVPWGGRFNYGHFVLDGLSGLLALEEAGLTRSAPALCPPLARWQADLTRMAFPGLTLRTVRAPIVRLEAAAFASNLNHFLHRPNALVARLAERIRRPAPLSQRRRRLYLSRGGYSMRVMINAREVEAALRDRGFDIVEPHRLSAADQVALMAEAHLIVGPTGAAMTNALFAAPGTTVLEIQPENFASFWLGAACHAADRDWHGFICASPAPATDTPWLARRRRGFKFGYRVPVPALLKVLDRL